MKQKALLNRTSGKCSLVSAFWYHDNATRRFDATYIWIGFKQKNKKTVVLSPVNMQCVLYINLVGLNSHDIISKDTGLQLSFKNLEAWHHAGDAVCASVLMGEAALQEGKCFFWKKQISRPNYPQNRYPNQIVLSWDEYHCVMNPGQVVASVWASWRLWSCVPGYKVPLQKLGVRIPVMKFGEHFCNVLYCYSGWTK